METRHFFSIMSDNQPLPNQTLAKSSFFCWHVANLDTYHTVVLFYTFQKQHLTVHRSIIFHMDYVDVPQNQSSN